MNKIIHGYFYQLDPEIELDLTDLQTLLGKVATTSSDCIRPLHVEGTNSIAFGFINIDSLFKDSGVIQEEVICKIIVHISDILDDITLENKNGIYELLDGAVCIKLKYAPVICNIRPFRSSDTEYKSVCVNAFKKAIAEGPSDEETSSLTPPGMKYICKYRKEDL